MQMALSPSACWEGRPSWADTADAEGPSFTPFTDSVLLLLLLLANFELVKLFLRAASAVLPSTAQLDSLDIKRSSYRESRAFFFVGLTGVLTRRRIFSPESSILSSFRSEVGGALPPFSHPPSVLVAGAGAALLPLLAGPLSLPFSFGADDSGAAESLCFDDGLLEPAVSVLEGLFPRSGLSAL